MEIIRTRLLICEETGQKERQWRSQRMLKPRRCLSCLQRYDKTIEIEK